jgi:aminomethyltransferase
VVAEDGQPVGLVTSGNFSPMLEHGIALGLVDTGADAAPGSTVTIEQRGRTMEATVVKTPFVLAGQFAARR